MKVFFVSNTSYYLHNFRRNLLLAAIDKGYDVTAVAPEDAHTGHLKDLGVKFIPLRSMDRKGMNPARDIRLFFELFALFRREKPGLILNFTVKPNIYSSLAAGALGIPSISTVTGLGYVFTRRGILNSLVRTLYRVAFKFPRKVVFQNPDDLNEFKQSGIVKDRQCLTTGGSGADLRRFFPADEALDRESPVFLMCARLLKGKGVFEFAQAAEAVRSNHPHVRFHLLGPVDMGNPDAVSPAELESIIGAGHVKYLGVTDDVRPSIAKSFAVVLPSRYREGVPKILIEALAMAKPVITTNTPGCRLVVDDGENGFLVAPSDAGDLARCVTRLLQLSDADLCKMRNRSLQKARVEFDERRVIEVYLQAMGGAVL